MSGGIASLAEFYAHALAIEAEAAERYGELAHAMAEHHNDRVADLFHRLARMEADHAREIRVRSASLPLPRIPPWEYRWEGVESPEAASYEEAHYLMTPYHALQLALRNEQRAVEFFEKVARSSPDAQVRALAAEFAAEERQHVGYVERALGQEARPTLGWDEDLDPPQSVA